MTPAEFSAIFPRAAAATWAPAVTAAWLRFGFVTVESRAGFLGVCGNETGGFTAVRTEDTRWSAATMVARLGVAQVKAAQLSTLSGEARANYCYQHRNGNGDEASGDGWRYRGRGIVQLTGRANYRAAGHALGLDLEGNPDLACNDAGDAALIAAWFMAQPGIKVKLDAPSEASFLEGARKVGATDAAATKRRLDFRAAALAVLRASGQAAAVAPPPQPSPRAAPTVGPPQNVGRLEWIIGLLRKMFGLGA